MSSELSSAHYNAENNRMSLCHWFPQIKELGIPVPRTAICYVDRSQMYRSIAGDPLPREYYKMFDHAVRDVRGYPLFIRTDLSSGKHLWKSTCYVENGEKLIPNMLSLCQANGTADIPGLSLQFEAIIFREFLDLAASFKAFRGDMPINKERRYFVRDGVVVCHHPYWPTDSIVGRTQDANWQEKLAALNAEDKDEVEILTRYAERVGCRLPGFWSIDFAQTKNGTWYLLDMADGGRSFHWEGCKA